MGLRGQGNNSLHLTESTACRPGPEAEFRPLCGRRNYHGLDSSLLDASFQDNSYLQDLPGLPHEWPLHGRRPLCSYAWVTVNGALGPVPGHLRPEEAFSWLGISARV